MANHQQIRAATVPISQNLQLWADAAACAQRSLAMLSHPVAACDHGHVCGVAAFTEGRVVLGLSWLAGRSSMLRGARAPLRPEQLPHKLVGGLCIARHPHIHHSLYPRTRQMVRKAFEHTRNLADSACCTAAPQKCSQVMQNADANLDPSKHCRQQVSNTHKMPMHSSTWGSPCARALRGWKESAHLTQCTKT